MSSQITTQRDNEWNSYYERFDYFSPTMVRDGCHPRIAEHPDRATQAIVLVHGLSDSPYYMTAIADYFFHTLGFNVYLPLLHCHGLKDPKGMEDVKLEEWKANVTFAIDCATLKADHVSIGGLSTGGTLGLHAATHDARVDGTLYLFSAALSLAGGFRGVLGNIKERLLRTSFVDVLDSDEPLIDSNPFRYSRVDIDGARELARLMKETDRILAQFSPREPWSKEIFAAHSESDERADIACIERLQDVTAAGRFTFFRIPKSEGVAHASVVLNQPIYATNAAPGDEPLEKANPLFGEMLESLGDVARKGSTHP